MKNISFLLIFCLFTGLTGCKKSAPEVTPDDPAYKGSSPSGTWTAEQGGGGGFNQFATFKNFQYSFTVSGSNQTIGIQLTSPDIDVQFALFDPLGQQLTVAGQSRSLKGSYTLNAGTYRLVVAANRQAVGSFTLAMSGLKDGVTRLTAPQLAGNGQDWGTLGGGGTDVSYKNQFYTVDVTDDNTSIDIELESADTDVTLALFDPLGSRIFSRSGGRYQYVIQGVKKGTYTIMAGTGTRAAVGKFNLRVTGKVANLKRVESQSTTVTGKWDTSSPASATYPNEPYALYSVRLTAASSPIDIDLVSPDVSPVVIRLLTEGGTPILTKNLVSRSSFLVSGNLSQGTYLIRVYPGSKIYGSYTLSVVGQYADFKKL